MNLPEAEKLGALQTRNHTEYSRLLRKPHVILESHQVVARRAQVFLPQLHHRVRPPAAARILEPNRLHRTEPQGFPPLPGQFFNGQARFEKSRVTLGVVFWNMRWNSLGRENRVHESLVLLSIHWAIQIVV